MLDDSFRHWQEKALEQKQLASTLLLAMSCAALGFSVDKIALTKEYVGCPQSALFIVQGVALLFSIIAGTLFSLNRVGGYGFTAQRVRARNKNEAPHILKEKKNKMQRADCITKKLYCLQITLFSIGASVFVLFFVALYKDMIFSKSFQNEFCKCIVVFLTNE